MVKYFNSTNDQEIHYGDKVVFVTESGNDDCGCKLEISCTVNNKTFPMLVETGLIVAKETEEPKKTQENEDALERLIKEIKSLEKEIYVFTRGFGKYHGGKQEDKECHKEL